MKPNQNNYYPKGSFFHTNCFLQYHISPLIFFHRQTIETVVWSVKFNRSERWDDDFIYTHASIQKILVFFGTFKNTQIPNTNNHSPSIYQLFCLNQAKIIAVMSVRTSTRREPNKFIGFRFCCFALAQHEIVQFGSNQNLIAISSQLLRMVWQMFSF